MIKREYYSNGELSYEVIYYKGLRHGIAKWWYRNGQLGYEAPYHEGQLHGIIKQWYKDGQLEGERYYLYDNRVTQEEYRRHELIVKLSGL